MQATALEYLLQPSAALQSNLQTITILLMAQAVIQAT
jgi:hypothetical protein